MTWQPHIISLTNRIRRLLQIFRNLRDAADSTTVKNVYYSLCQSLLTYCITIWGGTATSHLLKLERAQRAVIKVMFRKPRLYNTNKLYEECRLLTVRQLFIFNTVIRYHKCLDHTQLPVSKRRVRIPVPKLLHGPIFV